MPTELQSAPAELSADFPKLAAARDESLDQIRRQLERGFVIRSLKIRNPAELEKARDQKLEWTQHVLFVLTKIYESDVPGEEFNRWVGKILPEFADLSAFVEHFQDEMDQRLRKLLEFYKRVEAEPDVVPRKVEAMASQSDAAIEEALELPRVEPLADAPPAAPARVTPSAPSSSKSGRKRSSALIVHARNEAVEEAISHFVARLGFETIVLGDQVASGKGIVSQLSEHAELGFAMVLASPDDAAAARQGNDAHSSASRSDFELGYCAGKLGFERVCVLHTGAPGLFHDRHGIFYIPVDPAEGWQLQLAKHLRRAGIEVDLNKLC